MTLGLTVPKLNRKCVGVELLHGTLLVVSSTPYTTSPTDVELSLIYKSDVLYKEDGAGVLRLAWTGTQIGEHLVCIANFGNSDSKLWLDIKVGPEARDYSQVARKEHLEPVVLLLRRLEDYLRAHHKNLLYLRKEEVKFREMASKASRRSIMFCFVGVSSFLGATLFQVLYFRHFMRMRKVI